jgi:hypothetical protein
LQSLAVATDTLHMLDASIAHGLRKLELAVVQWLRLFIGTTSYIIAANSRVLLPFDQLQEVKLWCDDSQITTTWLVGLQTLLWKSRKTLAHLDLIMNGDRRPSIQQTTEADFSAYTALRSMKIVAKTNTSCIPTLDENRVQLRAPTLMKLELEIAKIPITTLQTLCCIHEIIRDNIESQRMPTLRTLVLTVNEGLMQQLRQSDHAIVYPPPTLERRHLFRRIAHSNGRVDWKPVNTYSDTVAILRELAKVTNVMLMIPTIEVDVSSIRKVVEHEDSLADEREQMDI